MATYFVDQATGSDSDDGLSLGDAFETIDAAASIMVAADICYIRAGTYRETLTPINSGSDGSPIRFENYNSEEVIISGADVITGWSLDSGSIYTATMSWDLGDGFNQIFADGVMVNEARWPSTGTDLLEPTLAAATTTAGNDVTFTVTRAEDYWVGGIIMGIFGEAWMSQGATITASSTDGVMTVDGKTDIWWEGAGEGWISNIQSELDSANEWFLNGTTLYLWAPGSVNPSTMVTEAKARKWCVNLSGLSYIEIYGINMFAGAINMNADNCTVEYCDLEYLSHFTKYTWSGWNAEGNRAQGDNGVWIEGDSNIFRRNVLTRSAGTGILLYGSNNLVTRNTVSEISYGGTYSCPLSMEGSTGNNQVTFNTMFNAGREIMQLFLCNNDEIMYNDVYNAGKLCHDLGVLYSWGEDGQGTRLAYNWVHDNLAAALGPIIYYDNYCRNFITDHNVIWGGTDAGIRYNGPTELMKAYNNTVFNCDDIDTHTYNIYPFYMPPYWIYGDVHDVTKTNNLFLDGTPESQLEDWENDDFRLKNGAAAIDAGDELPPYTNGFFGSAPDDGAYERNTIQWSAGVDGVAWEANTGGAGYVWANYTVVQKSAGDWTSDALADTTTETSDSIPVDSKAGATITIEAVEDNTGAINGVVTVYILGDVDGTNFEEPSIGSSHKVEFTPIQNDTIRIPIHIDSKTHKNFKVAVENQSGQELAISVRIATAEVKAAN